MSIWHSLQFEANKKKEEVSEILLSDTEFTKYSNGFETDGIYGRVSEIGEHSQEGIKEIYGFSPTLRITFDEDSTGDIEKGYKQMGKAIALVLKQESGNAIFFYVADTPILKRINGHIQIANDSYLNWLREAISDVGLKYEKVPKQNLEN